MSEINLRVPFGERERRLFAPGEVERGLSCGCVCPSCHSPLIANHPTKKRNYFSHHRNPECPGGYETAVHLMAKQIIEQAGGITIPGREIVVSVPLIEKQRLRGTVVFEPRWCELSGIESEQTVEKWRPDLRARLKNDAPLHIEIAVTHFVEPDKAEGLDNVMEIDLSTLDPDIARDPEALSRAVLQEAPRRWYRVSLFSRLAPVLRERKRLEALAPQRIQEIKDQRATEQRQQLNQQRFQAHREQQRETYTSHLANLAKMSDPRTQKRAKAHMADKCATAIAQTRDRLGAGSASPGALPHGVGESVDGDWIVRTHPVIWQALVLEYLVLGKAPETEVRVHQALDLVRQRFGFLPWLEELAALKSQHKRQGRTRGAWYGESGIWFLSREENRSIKTPYYVILKYLTKLCELGYLREETSGSIFRVVNNRLRRVENLEHARLPRSHPQAPRQVSVGPHKSEALRKRHIENEQQRREKGEQKEAHYRRCEQVLAELLARDVRQAQLCSYCHLLTEDLEASLCPTCNDGALDPVELTDEYVYSYPHRIRCRPSFSANRRGE